MSDINFQYKHFLANFLVITNTTKYGQVEAADVTSARLLFQRETLAHGS